MIAAEYVSTQRTLMTKTMALTAYAMLPIRFRRFALRALTTSGYAKWCRRPLASSTVPMFI